MKNIRSAEWRCEVMNCDFEEEALIGEHEIRRGRERAKYHHKTTGHTVTFIILSSYTYGNE